MKCQACGYVRIWSGMDGLSEVGDENFIAVDMLNTHLVFACPKCGTMKIDRDRGSK